jgi:hypothetical protein
MIFTFIPQAAGFTPLITCFKKNGHREPEVSNAGKNSSTGIFPPRKPWDAVPAALLRFPDHEALAHNPKQGV